MKKKRRKMKPGGGAKKGSAFERKMAGVLSKWWYGETGYLWRRPGPGTRFFKKDKHRHSGDIVPSVDRRAPKEFPFHAELKCFSKARLKLDMLLWPDRNPIKKIWTKALEERRAGLMPMLILKANNTPIICVMRRTDLKILVNKSGFDDVKDVVTNHVQYDDIDMDWVVYVFPFDDLLKLKVKHAKIVR